MDDNPTCSKACMSQREIVKDLISITITLISIAIYAAPIIIALNRDAIRGIWNLLKLIWIQLKRVTTRASPRNDFSVKEISDNLNNVETVVDFWDSIKTSFLRDEGANIKAILKEEVLRELREIKREQAAQFRAVLQGYSEDMVRMDRLRMSEFKDVLRWERERGVVSVKDGEVAEEVVGREEDVYEDEGWVDIVD